MKTITKTLFISSTIPALAVSGAVPCQARHLKKAPRPNIVYIMMDDAGYGDFGCYGQKMIETPNIDALAATGIRFTQMYTVAPISSPSRCGLLTGLHSGHMQIRANDDYMGKKTLPTHAQMLADSTLEGQFPFASGTVTLGTVLKNAGYATGIIGKWGNGGPASTGAPNKMGFDYFFGYCDQREAHLYYPPFLWENNKRVYLDNKLIPTGTQLDEGADPMDIRSYDKYTQKTYSPDIMYDRVIKFVDRNTAGPFLLMWHPTIPHSAVQAPLDEVMHYVKKLGDEAPRKSADYFPSRYPHATYAAMITHLDKQIGGLVSELKRLGIYENTVIIVTSDNGPACNSNSPMEYFQSGGPFRCRKQWGKSSLHEGGIRMPFIVAWGSGLAPSVSNHIGMLDDMMPTFSDLSGAECPKTDGISILPTIEGRTGKQKQHDFLYWEYPRNNGWVAVRWGDWKGLLKKVLKGNDKMELYNLATDPREDHDVSTEHPDIVARMWKMAESSHVEPSNHNPFFMMDIPYPDKK
ncbi:MAG: arylsulfatase [Bacteroidales bacterium]|jgi:arylsulfatase|nr:arylsulfatase [Bacteroidales bacterium]